MAMRCVFWVGQPKDQRQQLKVQQVVMMKGTSQFHGRIELLKQPPAEEERERVVGPFRSRSLPSSKGC